MIPKTHLYGLFARGQAGSALRALLGQIKNSQATEDDARARIEQTRAELREGDLQTVTGKLCNTLRQDDSPVTKIVAGLRPCKLPTENTDWLVLVRSLHSKRAGQILVVIKRKGEQQNLFVTVHPECKDAKKTIRERAESIGFVYHS